MWILISVGVLLVISGLLGLYVTRKEKKKMDPMQKGLAIGGIAGAITGIALVEFFGQSYPLPFVLWLLGMAIGQLAGWLYKKKRGS
jgi:hypothetical protein